MPDCRGISYPVPAGVPPRGSDMEYDAATALLPLEEQLIEQFFKNTEHSINHSIQDIGVFGRRHTGCGHYTEFSREPREIPKNSQNENKDGCCFQLKDCNEPFGAIFYIYYNKLDSIEIHKFGMDFPPDGITRSITAITFGDPNLPNWKKEIVQ